MRRRRWAIVLVSLALAAGAGCGSDDGGDDAEAPDPVQRADVEMRALKFVPETVSVFTGGTVVWHFTDGAVKHNVVADEFQSDVTSSGTFEHTFDGAGRFDYVCTLHPRMTGTVVVVDRS